MALTGTATGVVPAKARLPFGSSRPATSPSLEMGRGPLMSESSKLASYEFFVQPWVSRVERASELRVFRPALAAAHP